MKRKKEVQRVHIRKDTKEESREVVGGTSENYTYLLHNKKYKKGAVSIMLLMFFVSFKSLNMDPVQLTGLHHCLQQLREIKRIFRKSITMWRQTHFYCTV